MRRLALAALLLSCRDTGDAITAAGSSGSDVTGAEPTGGLDPAAKLLFLSNRDGVPGLYWMNADGSEQAPLSLGKADVSTPAWTAHGAEIVFSRDSDVWRLRLDTSEEINLTASPDHYDVLAAAAPDGSFVVVATQIDFQLDLYRVDIPGGAVTRLTELLGVNSFIAEVSPDGQRIAYVTKPNGGDEQLVVMSASGADAKDLAGPLGLHGMYDLSWAPDSARLAVSGQTEELLFAQRVHVLGADGTGLTPLSESGSYGLAWSPNGQHIAFETESPDLPFIVIHVIGSDGSDERALTADDTNCRDPDWAPDSSRLAFRCSDVQLGELNIYTASIHGGAPKRLTEGSVWNQEARWRP